MAINIESFHHFHLDEDWSIQSER